MCVTYVEIHMRKGAKPLSLGSALWMWSWLKKKKPFLSLRVLFGLPVYFHIGITIPGPMSSLSWPSYLPQKPDDVSSSIKEHVQLGGEYRLCKVGLLPPQAQLCSGTSHARNTRYKKTVLKFTRTLSFHFVHIFKLYLLFKIFHPFDSFWTTNNVIFFCNVSNTVWQC